MKTNNMLVGDAWKRAGEILGVRVEAPYIVTMDGNEVACTAHLPDFGSANGMILGVVSPPEYLIDAAVKQIAKAKGKYCSFVNSEVYESYDDEIFKEALRDWGFCGPDDKRPVWLNI